MPTHGMRPLALSGRRSRPSVPSRRRWPRLRNRSAAGAHCWVLPTPMLLSSVAPFLIQWITGADRHDAVVCSMVLLIVGLVLLYLAITGPGGDFRPRRPPLHNVGECAPRRARRNAVRHPQPARARGAALAGPKSRFVRLLRTQERARLARDFHYRRSNSSCSSFRRPPRRDRRASAPTPMERPRRSNRRHSPRATR